MLTRISALLPATCAVLFLAQTPLFATPAAPSPLMCSNPGSTTASPTDAGIAANSCTDFSYLFPSTQPATGLNNWQYGYYTSPNTTPPSLNPNTFALMTPTPAYDSSGILIPGTNAGWWSKDFYHYWTALDAFGGHSNAAYTNLHSAPYCDTSGMTYSNCSPSGGLDPQAPASPDSGNYWATWRYIVPSNFSGTVSIDVQTQKDPRTANASSQGYSVYILDDSAGTATTLGNVDVPVNTNAALAGLPPTPSGIGQPIYSWSGDVPVNPGDLLDFVIVPNFNSTYQSYADFSSGSFELITLDGVLNVPEGGSFDVVPEPGTFGVMGAGLILLLGAQRRFRKA